MKVSLNNGSTKISLIQVAVENFFLEEQHALVDLSRSNAYMSL
jgi:hypothetical protein